MKFLWNKFGIVNYKGVTNKSHHAPHYFCKNKWAIRRTKGKPDGFINNIIYARFCIFLKGTMKKKFMVGVQHIDTKHFFVFF